MILIIFGVVSAIWVWRHDLGRLRIEASAPQAAPKRMPPEIHVLSAGLTGVGVGLLWSFWIALGAFAVQVTLAYAVLPRLLERLAYGPPRR
jgi:hypothetical protein